MNWYDDIFERTVNMDEDSYNYTLIAESRFQKVIYADAFLDVDARTIYEGLCNDLRLVSFCDYLKRYVYTKAGLKVPFSQVTLQDYKAIILASFKENRTPPAFRTTSAKLGSLINGWLKQESVSRETVFLLGFGLRMTPGDVSVFLTKALREQDFNFKDPFEMICWYCLKNQYRAAAAIRFREEYEALPPVNQDVIHPDAGTVFMKDVAMSMNTDQDLRRSLQILKGQHRRYIFSTTAFREFQYLYSKARERLYAEMKERPDCRTACPEDITPADLESSLYSGIPRTKTGNLKKASASSLARNFSEKRLNRQRIGSLLAGKTSVCRYDLITLSFYNLTFSDQGSEEEDPVDRCRHFIAEMNQRLSNCFMGDLNISNPYESFLLMCLLTDYPFDSFEEVWEYAYVGETS